MADKTDKTDKDLENLDPGWRPIKLSPLDKMYQEMDDRTHDGYLRTLRARAAKRKAEGKGDQGGESKGG